MFWCCGVDFRIWVSCVFVFREGKVRMSVSVSVSVRVTTSVRVSVGAGG